MYEKVAIPITPRIKAPRILSAKKMRQIISLTFFDIMQVMTIKDRKLKLMATYI